MNRLILRVSFIITVLSPFFLHGQATISGQTEDSNPITVAVPFVNFAPDSRSSGMGDVGVATSPDAYSAHWNISKLAFIDHNIGFSFSYSPWLGNLVDDMSLNYLTFYKKIDKIQSFGASLRYFDMGEIQLTDIQANAIGVENPREAAIDASYARQLIEDRLSMGLSLRFIWSNIAGNITGAPNAGAGTSLAFDLGAYYTQPLIIAGKNVDMSYGIAMTNIGQKITYTTQDQEDFIPGNLRLGTAWKTYLDSYNSLTFALDMNKLMVPTPPIYETDTDGNLVLDTDGNPIIAKGKDPDRPFISGTFGSFTDAPGGIVEEMQEITWSLGIEYMYRDVFAFRTGYFFENEKKGNRKYFTVGLGFRYQVFGLDLSYLIPQVQDHPLGDTLRLSFVFNMNKEADGNGG